MPEYAWLEVKVWGAYACFTRPEMKAERVSYPVMTPSAARGLLEAIFWKPEMSWQAREIWVLHPIRHFSMLRNEVNSKATPVTARGWVKTGGGYFAEEDRAQRHTLGYGM
jgi:CRISPR-associated protein Cas5d